MQITDFKQNVLPLSRKMIRIAGCYLNDNDGAKDIVQDVFLKLWQIRGELDDIQNLEAFVTRMVRNKCVDHLRINRKVIVMESPDNKNEKATAEPDRLVLKETTCRIWSLMEQLPEQQQTVMYLRDVEQYEYKEIEDKTGLSINAIRANLSRARKKVREELLKTWNYEEAGSRNITQKIL